MVKHSQALDQTLAAAQQGDDAALGRLLAECRGSLVAAAAELSAMRAATEEERDDLVEQTLVEAESKFNDFDGAGSAEFADWLAGILERRAVSASDQAPGDTAAATGNRDETIVKPPEDARKADAPAPPLPPASDETLVRPPGEQTLVKPPSIGDPSIDSENTLIADMRPQDLPTLGVPGGAPAASAPPKKHFGDYELLETIARGGMGVVYKARQRKLNRVVALKMILAGQFADEVEVERFYVEAQAAANLRHPNIVAVHEVGESEGQHFFSMDYVDGQSLGDAVRDRPLSPQLAARYAKTIAETMQFAHEQGILHRDLKPSNVLLDRATGEPLITDFGLAKRTTSESQLTMTGAIVGTPSYMPPEQAAGAGENVSTLSDVYSIGAILYELLTGSPPFSAANPFETIKQVMEVEPASPRLLNASVPRDLETICLKCLQKEPARRYASAQHLADELARFLEGLPILARPVGPVGRTWRWCRRNPVVAGLLLLAATGLVVAFAGVTVGYVQATVALADARQSFNQARKAIDRLFTIVSENRLLNEPGFQPLRKELLMNARELYEQILAQRGDDPAIRDELALSYFRLGRIMALLDSPSEALQTYETALALQEQLHAENPADKEVQLALSDTLNEIGESRFQLREYDLSLVAYERSEQLRRKLADADANDPLFQRKLVNTFMNVGLVEKAIADQTKDFDEATPHYDRAFERYEQAQKERHTLLDRFGDDLDLRLDLAKGYFNLANIALQLTQDQRAADYLQQAIEQFDQLVDADPASLENRYLRAICVRQLGDVYTFLADIEQAQQKYEAAEQELRSLAGDNPDVHKYQAALAAIFQNQGMLWADNADAEKALLALQEALGILRPLVERFPEPAYRRDLGKTLREAAFQQMSLGKSEAARGNLNDSRRELEQLLAEFPGHPDFTGQLQLTVDALEQLAPEPQDAAP